MKKLRTLEAVVFSDLGILIILALARCVTLLLSNGAYGWHRDELDTLDNAHYLTWGYVAYPPFAPFIARIALTLFGPSIIGVRLFSTLAQASSMILAGLMVKELGGRRWAQVVAAVAVAIAPFALLGGNIFHYSSFDYLWWVLITYLMIKLLKSENPRWWLGVGAAIGMGMMTKYTIAFLVISLVISVILTRTRRYLLNPWLWGGVALALLIVMPNLIWQIQHDFISLDFMSGIHARDVDIGRAEGFLLEQFIFSANVVTIPLWIVGLYFYLFSKNGRNYRAIGWIFVITFILLFVAQGRSYYLAPAYPMLFAGGSVVVEGWLSALSAGRKRLIKGMMWGLFAVGGIVFAVVALPIAPVNSQVWDTVSEFNGELKEQIGWPELVETVADVYASLPEEDRLYAGILTGNYGEAGAINLYGPAYGLPTAISGVNSYWGRGYGDPPPQILIVIGLDPGIVYSQFESCKTAGRITNLYGVMNEETKGHPQILLCGPARRPWPDLWEQLRSFG
jgi:4-amino-4-deoxy-L-arabinose transferase-like glycosyltransferase